MILTALAILAKPLKLIAGRYGAKNRVSRKDVSMPLWAGRNSLFISAAAPTGSGGFYLVKFIAGRCEAEN
jgi:hypothetical protein